jgi:hypothetical protein
VLFLRNSFPVLEVFHKIKSTPFVEVIYVHLLLTCFCAGLLSNSVQTLPPSLCYSHRACLLISKILAQQTHCYYFRCPDIAIFIRRSDMFRSLLGSSSGIHRKNKINITQSEITVFVHVTKYNTYKRVSANM